jgi:transposase
MRWVGLDLHKHYLAACALDDGGHLVAEHRRLPPDVAAVVAWLQGLGDAVTVAMEATLHWAWLHDQLSAAGVAAVTAHPYQVKLIWQARPATDIYGRAGRASSQSSVREALRGSRLVWESRAQARARPRNRVLEGRPSPTGDHPSGSGCLAVALFRARPPIRHVPPTGQAPLAGGTTPHANACAGLP